jgi:hypothetical protein
MRSKAGSWHSLRHSAGSVWLTEYGLPVTTVSAMMGHANPSFTLACYGRDPRDTETMVAARENELQIWSKKAQLAGLFIKPEDGFEPTTPCLQDRCSDQLSYSGLPRMVDGPQACGQFASASRCGRGSGEVTIARAASQPTTTTSPPSAASTMKWFPVATMIRSIARG